MTTAPTTQPDAVWRNVLHNSEHARVGFGDDHVLVVIGDGTTQQLTPKQAEAVGRALGYAAEKLTPIDDAIGFKAMRKAAGLSLRELADLLGCTRSWLRDVESGDRRPSAHFVTHFAAALAELR